MKVVTKVLNRQEFIDNPPVLMDIGAAIQLHAKWKSIAKYAICIAFDADDRQMEYEHKEAGNYKKLCIVNSIVTDGPAEESDFYLTVYPSCSSLLMPNKASLKNWSFGELFDVEKVVKLKTTGLQQTLTKLNIKKIDWIKIDAQGADLRLFNSLGDKIIRKILMAEFEPGILDAYIGEDKLCTLMQYMEKLPYWMSDIIVKGAQRISLDVMDTRFTAFEKDNIAIMLKTSPAYAEVTFLNSFTEDMEKRDFLLGWVLSMLEKQYGFAIEIAIRGHEKYRDPIFQVMETDSLDKMKNNLVQQKGCMYFIKKWFCPW